MHSLQIKASLIALDLLNPKSTTFEGLLVLRTVNLPGLKSFQSQVFIFTRVTLC